MIKINKEYIKQIVTDQMAVEDEIYARQSLLQDLRNNPESFNFALKGDISYDQLNEEDKKEFTSEIKLCIVDLIKYQHEQTIKSDVELWNDYTENRSDCVNFHYMYNVHGCFDIDLTGIDFSGCDLRGIQLLGVNLEGVNFKNADLRGADLRQTNMKKVNMKGAIIDNTTMLQNANIESVSFKDMEIKGLKLGGAHLKRCDLSGCKIHNSYFEKTQFDFCTLIDTDMSGSVTDCARFISCDMESCNINNSSQYGCYFIGCNLNSSSMKNSNMERGFLERCNLENSDFSGTNLMNSDLQICEMNSANFKGTEIILSTILGCNMDAIKNKDVFHRDICFNHRYFLSFHYAHDEGYLTVENETDSLENWILKFEHKVKDSCWLNQIPKSKIKALKKYINWIWKEKRKGNKLK